tara:strand:- start:708 stop:902 length:195 start_codon:yes stop_codon:yes gene_type:complete
MKTYRKDIIATLTMKLSLLFLLWFVCFKPIEKTKIPTVEHFLGVVSTNYNNSVENHNLNTNSKL